MNDNKLKTIIKNWLNYGQEEISFKNFIYIQSSTIKREQTKNKHSEDLKNKTNLENNDIYTGWFELKTRGWLKSSIINHRFSLSPDAIQFFYKERQEDKIGFVKAHKSLERFKKRMNEWNNWADQHHYPTIAIAVLWGSFAKGMNFYKKYNINEAGEKYGDLDVVIVWRGKKFNLDKLDNQSFPKNMPSKYNHLISSHSDKWQVEDAVEAWLSDIPHVNISNTDQWNEFFNREDIFSEAKKTYIIEKDRHWDEIHDKHMGLGIKKEELEDINKYVFSKKRKFDNSLK